jgi:alanyl aminopeptidase
MKDIYSQFVYQKAGAILMMVEAWLGEGRFRDGLRQYLRAHANGTATTDDLGQTLSATAVLHNFLDNPGIPVVHAALHCDAPQAALAIDIGRGPIPVCYKGDGIARRCAVFETGHQEVPLDRCPAWIYPNAGGTGYYRSDFDARALPLDQLTPAERLTFDNDRKAQEKKSAPQPQ